MSLETEATQLLAGMVSPFLSTVAQEDDKEVLRSVGMKFFGDTKVSKPVFERLVSLDPSDLEAWTALGTIRFMLGDDDEARGALARAQSIDPLGEHVLELQAALERDATKQVEIYWQLLRRYPSNVVARGQLHALDEL